jgi:hypothetical protein
MPESCLVFKTGITNEDNPLSLSRFEFSISSRSPDTQLFTIIFPFATIANTVKFNLYIATMSDHTLYPSKRYGLI